MAAGWRHTSAVITGPNVSAVIQSAARLERGRTLNITALAGPSLIKFGTREGGREGGGREGRGGGGQGRGGQGREGRGGEGRGLSTLSTNQNICDRGA